LPILCKQSLHWYDFGGIQYETARALLDGQSRRDQEAASCDFFKLNFGGEPILMPAAVEMVHPRLLRGLDVVQGSGWGRGMIDSLRRRLRNGHEITPVQPVST
jgi:hypothetical protein